MPDPNVNGPADCLIANTSTSGFQTPILQWVPKTTCCNAADSSERQKRDRFPGRCMKSHRRINEFNRTCRVDDGQVSFSSVLFKKGNVCNGLIDPFPRCPEDCDLLHFFLDEIQKGFFQIGRVLVRRTDNGCSLQAWLKFRRERIKIPDDNVRLETQAQCMKGTSVCTDKKGRLP